VRRACVRTHRSERGASLILAIVFLLVIGGIGGAVTASVTSGVKDRRALDRLRDQEYAADGAVEYAIAQVRQIPLPGGPGLSPCGPTATPFNYFLPPDTLNNNVKFRVDCLNQPTFYTAATPPLLQRDVVFTACVDHGTPCNDNTTIIRAQVNFQARDAGSVLTVTRTWVQSWSVNG
jgi:hypothetical protein